LQPKSKVSPNRRETEPEPEQDEQREDLVDEASERKADSDQGVPVVYPFLPTPPPIPVSLAELALALDPGTADAPGTGEAAPELSLQGQEAVVDLEAGVVAEGLAGDEASVGAEEGVGIDATLLDGLNSPDDTTLPEGLRAIRPDANRQSGLAQSPDFSSLIGQAESCTDSSVSQPTGERVPLPVPEGDRNGAETVIEAAPTPDEGVSGRFAGLAPSRPDTVTTASPQSDAAPTSSVTRDEVPQQVARLSASMVRELSGDGVKEIRVRLDPPSLGEIRLHVEMDGGEVRIQVVAASPETASLLSDGQSNLRDELARQGLALGSFSTGTESTFSFASESGFTPREQEARPGAAGRSDAGGEVTEVTPVLRRRSAAGLLDAQA
jgi:hypothetical protein